MKFAIFVFPRGISCTFLTIDKKTVTHIERFNSSHTTEYEEQSYLIEIHSRWISSIQFLDKTEAEWDD